jgi:hypothetical protein
VLISTASVAATLAELHRTPTSVPVVSLTPSPDKPLAVRRVHWTAAVRIIPGVFPAIDLFERVARKEDIDAVHAIESAFNPRLRDATGDLSLVPREERVVGPGAGFIMAAFTHVSPHGSRFSNSTYGVFYAAQKESTAIAETKYHRERFLRATSESRREVDMRVLSVTVRAPLHDLRGMREIMPDVYRPDDYTASQLLGGALRAGGSNGVVYDSVRHDGGKCVAVFRPPALSGCRERRQLRYVWDGTRIVDVLEVRKLASP